MSRTSPPTLDIPSSPNSVGLQIIDTCTTLTLSSPTLFCQHPRIPQTLTLPSYAVLVTRPQSPKKLLFDLSIRPDWRNLAPAVASKIESRGWSIKPGKDVVTVLEEHGVAREEIDEVVWSHWHWDHLGTLSLFPQSTRLIVGPGTKDVLIPSWPEKEDAIVKHEDLKGREIIELDFSTEHKRCEIGGFEALDWWGDGSFYLLSTPGHAVGHIGGLARISASNKAGQNGHEFVFLGGDACHHASEFRPSTFQPLPETIFPNPLDPENQRPCPGERFERLLRKGDRASPICSIRGDGEENISHDPDEAEKTLQKLMSWDADERVLLVMTHDASLQGVVDFFPNYIRDFGEKGWKDKGRWRFLGDFAEAVEDRD